AAISRRSVSTIFTTSVAMEKLSRGAAYGHAVQFQSGNADAHGDGLAVLAARAHAFIEFQIIANHGNFGERVGTVADQGAVLERRGNLAIFDQVSFGSGENKFSVSDVNLAAAKIHRIYSALDRAQNVFR